MLSRTSRQYFLANVPELSKTDLPVTDKHNGEVVARVAVAGADVIDRAIGAAAAAAGPMARLPAYERQAVLAHCVDRPSARAADVLEVGGVVIDDVPSFRVDHMPYGGVKPSGLGREGIRNAMDEMSELRLLVIRETR